MKVSELIEVLEVVRQTTGDGEVFMLIGSGEMTLLTGIAARELECDEHDVHITVALCDQVAQERLTKNADDIHHVKVGKPHSPYGVQ